MKTQQKTQWGGAHGGLFQDVEICDINFSQGILLRPALDFLRFFTTSFELRAVDRSVYCHLSPSPPPAVPQSLSHNLRRHRSPSRHTSRGWVS